MSPADHVKKVKNNSVWWLEFLWLYLVLFL